MSKFEKEFFQKFDYTDEQVKQFFKNSEKDLKLATSANDPNIIYRIGYDAVLKFGIAVIAKNGYKTRSILGHHIKILNVLSDLFNVKDEIGYIHRIRRKRNIDLYEGGIDFTETEAKNLIKIIKKIFNSI